MDYGQSLANNNSLPEPEKLEVNFNDAPVETGKESEFAANPDRDPREIGSQAMNTPEAAVENTGDIAKTELGEIVNLNLMPPGSVEEKIDNPEKTHELLFENGKLDGAGIRKIEKLEKRLGEDRDSAKYYDEIRREDGMSEAFRKKILNKEIGKS